jgi:hypothetical protein
VFAAFISFIFGGAPGLVPTPLQELPFGATGAAVAKKTGFHRAGGGALAAETRGTLGASKALTGKTPDRGSALWWVYVVLAALATLVLVLVARALSRRRLRAT